MVGAGLLILHRTLIGIPIAGNILKANGGDYWGLILFAVCVYAASVLLVIISRGLASDWRIRTVF